MLLPFAIKDEFFNISYGSSCHSCFHSCFHVISLYSYYYIIVVFPNNIPNTIIRNTSTIVDQTSKYH